MTGPVAVLVGPPGAGKTTVGTLLAAALGVAFRDTDADIEAEAGKPIPDIFVDDGEPRFRELERAAVSRALAEHAGVLALGAGAIMDQDTRAELRAHPVVYLDVDDHEAVHRVGLDAPRPLLVGGNPRARWRQLMDQRRPLYREVAGIAVATGGRKPDEIAAELCARLDPRRGQHQDQQTSTTPGEHQR